MKELCILALVLLFGGYFLGNLIILAIKFYKATKGEKE